MKCLEQNFKKFKDGFLYRDNFEEILLEEVLELVTKKAYEVTEQRWQDLSKIGVPDEFWTATYGPDCASISYEELLKVFERQGEEGKSEVEKLMDLCSEDEALRNQIIDLEQCLQSSKDMLAATDILLEEQTEKTKAQENKLLQKDKEIEHLNKQLKELEIVRTRVKNMESEHRLLKRDFDLVFATNKSVQKKMEKCDQENRSLRKTIISLANQMEKLEHEYQGEQVEGFSNIHVNPKKIAKPHMVWDPSIQALVPIIDPTEQRNFKNHHQQQHTNNNSPHHHKKSGFKKFHHNTNYRQNHQCSNSFSSSPIKSNQNSRNSNGKNNNGRLVSPFPRRYTSSHIPRYRRKYEMNELKKVQQNTSGVKV